MTFFLDFLDPNGYASLAIVISIVLICAGLIFVFNHYVAKYIFIALIDKLLKKNHTGLKKIIIDNRLLHRIAYLIPAFLLYYFSDRFNFDYPNFKLFIASIVENLSEMYITFDIALILSATLNCVNDRYNQLHIAKQKPIKSYIQVIKILIFGVSIILMASILFHKPPIYFFTGVGATTAFLALVFKDSVMGFIASIQLAAYDMVRIGDWIEMPNFGADGEVREISLNTVKVQNFDNTIVTIPSHALLSSGIKNWRGMHEAGGRRVKRSIIIDINSIKMSHDDWLKKIGDLMPLIQTTNEKLHEKQLTNLGWFRAYLQAYLLQHPSVHKRMKTLIRQLQGTPTGLPIELYFFTNETDSHIYEAIQADIIEHVYAIMPRFDLRAFQYVNDPE